MQAVENPDRDSLAKVVTAEVEKDKEGDIVKVKYRPVLDINDHPVVREITADDLDEIGEAVMATILEGA